MNQSQRLRLVLLLLHAQIIVLVVIAFPPIPSPHAQIGQAPVGSQQIGGTVGSPHEVAPEVLQGYTALPQALLTGQKTADLMSPDERLRSAVEFCEMDFAKPSLTENTTDMSAAPLTYTNPDCAKVMKVWVESGAKARYEQEVAAWRAAQVDREKQLISRVAGETK